MPSTGRMRHLTTVQGSFHGRLLAARLGAEGILVELRGLSDGPYPLQGAVEVFVSEAHLDLGREILLADAVDAAFDADQIELDYGDGAIASTETESDWSFDTRAPASPQFARARPRTPGDLLRASIAVVLVVALVVVGLVVVAIR